MRSSVSGYRRHLFINLKGSHHRKTESKEEYAFLQMLKYSAIDFRQTSANDKLSNRCVVLLNKFPMSLVVISF